MSIFRTFFSIPAARGFEAQLERVSDAIRTNVERAVMATAFAVKNRAVVNAPRETGDLADVISVQGKGLNWKVGLLDVSKPSRGGNSAHQHPWVYGVWYEFGFTTRNINAHPFMRPAVEAEESAHIVRVETALNNGIRL